MVLEIRVKYLILDNLTTLDHDDGHSLQSDEALKEASYCWRDCLWSREDCTGWDTWTE